MLYNKQLQIIRIFSNTVMKLSKKDLQDKRNRTNTIHHTKEVTDLRKYNSHNYYKSASDFHSGFCDADKEILNYVNEKKDEEYKIMLNDFPPLNVTVNA